MFDPYIILYNEVSRVVGFHRKDRKDLVVSHIHAGTKEVQEHMPSANESCLVNAGEETSLMRMRSPSTGASCKMVRRVYIS